MPGPGMGVGMSTGLPFGNDRGRGGGGGDMEQLAQLQAAVEQAMHGGSGAGGQR